MARACSVCTSPNRADIDKALISGHSSVASIAASFGVSHDSVTRHKDNGHIPRLIAKAAEARTVVAGEDLVASLRELVMVAQNIMANAYQNGEMHLSLVAIRELARIYETLGKFTGQLDPSTHVNVLIQQRQEREAEVDTQLERLTVDELREFRRLLAKAQGDGPPALEMAHNGVSAPPR